MKKRICALVICVVMVLSIATACGSAAPSNSAVASVAPSSSAAASEAASVAPSEAAKPAELVYWPDLNPTDTKDKRNAAMGKIIDAYNKNNKFGVTIKVESLLWSEVETKLLQAAAAGTGPDLYHVSTEYIKQHIRGGSAASITDFATKLIADMPDYSFSADDLKIKGEIYGLPYEARTTLMYYRKDVYGDAFPNAKSLYDIIDICKGHTQGNTLGFAFPLSTEQNAGGLMQLYNQLLLSAGGRLFDENDKYIFNNEAGVTAAKWIKSLFDNGICNRSLLTMNADQEMAAFQAGTALAATDGTHRYSAYKNSKHADNIAAIFYPSFTEGEKPRPYVPAKLLVLGKFSKNVDIAEDFIAYSLSVDAQKNWFGTGLLPVRGDVFKLDDIKSSPDFDLISSFQKRAAEGGAVLFSPRNFTEVCVAFAEGMQNIIFNNADIQKTLDDLVAKANAGV